MLHILFTTYTIYHDAYSYDFQSLDALLRLMQNVVERHTETEVLENCAKTLELLCTEDHVNYYRCDVSRRNLIDRLVNKLREVLDDYASLIAGVSRHFVVIDNSLFSRN